MTGDRDNPALEPAWVSRDMNQAEPPVIANGMVFAYGSGENTSQAYPDVGLDFRMERRVPLSTHVTLYALDAQDGKVVFWSEQYAQEKAAENGGREPAGAGGRGRRAN